MTGLAHPECYARELHDCWGEISREHYVSESVQKKIAGDERFVLAQGLAFQKPGEIKEFSIKNLFSFILCEKHNNALHPFDAAGVQLAGAFIRLKAAEIDGKCEPETIVVNGDHFERWLLKTLIGCLNSGAMQHRDSNSMKGHLPLREWLECLYAGRPINGGQGLYVRPGKATEGPGGQRSNFGAGTLTAAHGTDPEKRFVLGANIFMFGFQLVLKMVGGENYHPEGMTEVNFRPSGIRADGNPISIKFEWTDSRAAVDLTVRRANTN